MKKLFLIIIGLCLCTALYADMNPYIIGSGGGSAGGTSYVFHETFESSEYDNSGSEAGTGTIDGNYSTDALKGTYSLHIADGDGTPSSVTFSFTEINGTTYGYSMIKFIDSTPTTHSFCVYLLDSSDNPLMGVRVRGGSQGVYINCGTTYASSPYCFASTIADSTLYYIWFDYTPGSGSDANANFYMGTSATKPGSACSEVTTGTSTANASKIRIQAMEGLDIIVDEAIVDDSAIGSPDA